MPQQQTAATAITGDYFLQDYNHDGGRWNLHFVNFNPGGGNPNDYYVQIPDSELPANINQNQLAVTLKQYLGWTVNQTFAPLNTFIASGTPISQP